MIIGSGPGMRWRSFRVYYRMKGERYFAGFKRGDEILIESPSPIDLNRKLKETLM
jgi:hypothetical protein